MGAFTAYDRGLMEVGDDTSGEIADSHSGEAPAGKRTCNE